MDMDNQNTKIYTDKFLAVTSLLFVFISVAGLAIYSQESIKIAATWMQWTTSVFTTPVLLFAFLAIIFTFGLAFSKYGKIKLGEGKHQYTTMSWIFMFILSGIGSSTLYWGFLDWAYYYQTPGLSLPPESREGVCGICETAILEGEAEHFDQYLSDAEKASQKSMMICVSRAKGKKLVLDL
ncbi:TPA: hypothetical protein JI218_16435 [Acinetobacter baumannii]|nr:hypothetical protein [Acinetobacter baumannii]